MRSPTITTERPAKEATAASSRFTGKITPPAVPAPPRRPPRRAPVGRGPPPPPPTGGGGGRGRGRRPLSAGVRAWACGNRSRRDRAAPPLQDGGCRRRGRRAVHPDRRAA